MPSPTHQLRLRPGLTYANHRPKPGESGWLLVVLDNQGENLVPRILWVRLNLKDLPQIFSHHFPEAAMYVKFNIRTFFFPVQKARGKKESWVEIPIPGIFSLRRLAVELRLLDFSGNIRWHQNRWQWVDYLDHTPQGIY